MKRLWAIPVLMLISAAIIVSGMRFVREYAKTVDEHLQAAQKSAVSGDMALAAGQLNAAEKEWVKAEKTLRWFVNSSDLSEIGLTVTLLPEYAQNDEKAELLANISAARVRLKHLARAEVIEE